MKFTSKTTFLSTTAIATALTMPVVFAGTSIAPVPLPNNLVRAVVGEVAPGENKPDQTIVTSSYSGNQLLGMQVQNKQGQSLGEVEDVVVNLSNGEVQYVVLGDNGGVLGLGESLYAVPWSEFGWTANDNNRLMLTLDIKPEQLDQARAMQSDQPWPREADENWDRPVRDGERTNRDAQDRDDQNRQDRQRDENRDRDERDGIDDQDDIDDRASDNADGETEPPDVRNRNIRPDHNSSEIGDNKPNRIDYQFEADRRGQANQNNQGDRANQADHDKLQRLTDLIGTDVQSYSEQSLGEIEDVVIDTEQAKVTHAKIGFGGTLLTQQKTVYVPIDQLTYSTMDNVMLTSISQNQLSDIHDEQNEGQIQDKSFREEVAAYFEDFEGADVKNDSVRNEHLHGIDAQERQERDQRAAQAWNADSDYNKMYKADSERIITGTVTSVGSYRPVEGAESGVRFRVQEESGQSYVIHAGPRSYINQQEFSPRYGERIEVTGSVVEFEGREVIMAREIEQGDKVVTIRNEQGQPQWDAE